MADFLRIEHLKKVYPPDILALENFDFRMKEGEFVSMIGPSGCGKTTLLKIIAGIEDYQEGEVLFKGVRILNHKDWNRCVIYQDIRLFPWMTATENICFVLENRGYKKREAKEIAFQWMKKMGIDEYGGRYPAEMSAGIKQKVGVCRVLAMDPEFILCDEPFSDLDWVNREFLQKEILRYWYENKKTVLFVTHNVEEAVYLAQRVVCMTARPGSIKGDIKIPLPEEGRWEILRSSKQVLESSHYVASFIDKEIEEAKRQEREMGY
jgi:ABC-type nitrate/sulfonate/bicarbonate transport system ATPase subunit